MSMTIPQGMLDAMRGVFETSLPRTCTISTPSAGTEDAYGEQTAGTPTEITDVPCSFAPLRAFERPGDTATLAGADHMLTFPVEVGGEHLTVPASSVVTVNADGNAPERVFRITGQLESSQAVGLRVAATLVQ